MENVRDITTKARSSWDNLDKKKKTRMTLVLIALILFLVIYSLTIGKSKYVVLFSDLDLQDAGNIVSDLDNKKIKYKLEDNGKTILIDQNKIDKYRIELAMEGKMPESSSGFEIFDDIGLMVTDEDRKIMYQRALEGELQRSIMSLDSVKSAKVHLVMSEKSIFESEMKDASASVILDIKDGYKISEGMIKGIAALVTGAVDNLPEENIQIIDSKGNLLSADLLEETSSVNILSKNQAIKDEFEKKLENNLNRLLGDVFGREKIRVVVNADLDFDAEESTIIKYSDPKIRSEQLNISGNNIDVIPEDSLIGDNSSSVVGKVAGDGSTYNRTVNNELDTETTTVIKAPGKVNKLTTSVVYDGVLSDLKAQQIETMVATAIGYDYDRDDLISVVGIEFENNILKGQDNNKDQKELSFLEEYKNVALVIVASALALAIIITTVKVILNRRKDKKSLEDTLIEEKEMLEREELERQAQEAAAKKRLDDLSVEDSLEEDRKAKTYAKENPELAADLIRAWLKDSN